MAPEEIAQLIKIMASVRQTLYKKYCFPADLGEIAQELHLHYQLKPYSVYRYVLAEAVKNNRKIGSRASFYRMLQELKEAIDLVWLPRVEV